MTDHRIGLTVHNLPSVMNGDLDVVIDPLSATSRGETARGGRGAVVGFPAMARTLEEVREEAMALSEADRMALASEIFARATYGDQWRAACPPRLITGRGKSTRAM